MARERKRALVRIGMNYFRLLASVALGLMLVRVLLQSIGEDGVGLVSLFGSTVGIAAMFKDIIRSCLIRELGTAHHSGDPLLFRRMYNSALVVTFVTGLVSLVMFGLLWIFVDLGFFNVNGMQGAAHGLLAARGIEVFATIILAPIFSMYLISERMVAHNLWSLMEHRLAQFAAAVWVTFVATPQDASTALIEFAWLSSVLTIAGLFVACGTLIVQDRRLIPAPRLVTRDAMRAVLAIGGWNAAVVTAMNLHIRSNAIIMNLAFNLTANLVFGLAVQLTSYTRRLAVGITEGLDAVSTRISSTQSGVDRLHRLIHHSTRLNAFVTMPSTVAIVVLAAPLLQIWVGDKVKDPAVLGPSAILVQILSVGIASRGIADGWTRIMYGAGHIRRYAGVILAAGLLNPIISILLIWVFRGESLELTAPAWAFTVSMFGVQAAGIPIIMSRALGMRYREIVGPLLRPIIAAVVAAPVLYLFKWNVVQWSVWTLLAALVAYGAAYALAAWFLVLTPTDRHDAVALLRGRRSAPRRREQMPLDDLTDETPGS